MADTEKPRKKRARRKASPKAVGRPSKYNKDMPQRMIDFYATAAKVNGSSTVVLKETFTVMPTLVGFANSICVSPRTLYNWADEYEEFAEAMEWANNIAADMVQQFAINNVWSPSISQFILKACHGFTDKIEIDTGVIRVVLDDLQKGAV